MLQRRPLCVHDVFEPQSSQCPAFVAELALLKAEHAEVFPPACFVFSAVELHHVGQRETGLLVRRPPTWIHRDPVQQSVAEALQFVIEVADGLARLTTLDHGAWQIVSLRNNVGTEFLEPTPKPHCGLAVFSVVVLDKTPIPIELIVEFAGRDGVLDDAPAHRRLAEVLRALVPKERLEVLDGVALDAGDQGPLNHGVQVNEGAAAQEFRRVRPPGSRTGP